MHIRRSLHLLALLATLPLTAHAQTYTGIDDASPWALDLGGSQQKYDGWYNFSAGTKSKKVHGVTQTISGQTGYPTAFASAGPWSSPMASQFQTDSTKKAQFNKVGNSDGSGYAVGYNSDGVAISLAHFNPNGTAASGAVWKKANGTAGNTGYGAIPSGDSLYAISFSNIANAPQSTLGIFEANPLANLQSVVLQIEIGSANGYDFWNHSVAEIAIGDLDASDAFPKITLTLQDTSKVTIGADFSSLLAMGYNGTAEMPTGPGGELEDQPIYINLYGFQWDLSAYENIASYAVTWQGVEHSSLYAAQLDQSDEYNQVIGVVPEPSTWALLVLSLGVVLCIQRNKYRMRRQA